VFVRDISERFSSCGMGRRGWGPWRGVGEGKGVHQIFSYINNFKV
jgi:hypothetical protein